MNFDDCIFSRRSCRDYLKKNVPLEMVGQILETARSAPSSGNLQNWEFIVVRDPEKRKRMSEIANQEWMIDAPVYIVICNKRSEVTRDYPERGELYSIQNCAVAASYIMLKANDLGLGSCFVGAINELELKELLKIPEDIIPEAIITIGYMEKVDESSDRIELKKLVSFESYNNRELKNEIFPLVKHARKITNKISDQPYKPSSLIRKAKEFVKKFKKENKK